jgi:hypothetical protein
VPVRRRRLAAAACVPTDVVLLREAARAEHLEQYAGLVEDEKCVYCLASTAGAQGVGLDCLDSSTRERVSGAVLPGVPPRGLVDDRGR